MLLTNRRRLPAELVDDIFAHVLNAEEIGTNPRVYVRVPPIEYIGARRQLALGGHDHDLVVEIEHLA